MKKFIYNDDLNTKKITLFIQDNLDLFKKRFQKNFSFIYNYPFILTYPNAELKRDKICKCCGQIIKNENEWYEWKDGFRPKIKDIYIDISKIAPILEEQKVIKNIDLKKQYDNFIVDFKLAFSGEIL